MGRRAHIHIHEGKPYTIQELADLLGKSVSCLRRRLSTYGTFTPDPSLRAKRPRKPRSDYTLWSKDPTQERIFKTLYYGPNYTKRSKEWKRDYSCWMNMLHRCYNPKNKAYKNYGARGITVCQEWKESFMQFILDMGPRPEGLLLERKDNDGNYEPSNCEWADRVTQQNNTRRNKRYPFKGKMLTPRQIADQTGLTKECITYRLGMNKPLEAPYYSHERISTS